MAEKLCELERSEGLKILSSTATTDGSGYLYLSTIFPELADATMVFAGTENPSNTPNLYAIPPWKQSAGWITRIMYPGTNTSYDNATITIKCVGIK